MVLYAVDSNNNFKDAVYSYVAPFNSATGVLSSIVIDLSYNEGAGIGFASTSRMNVTRQKVSFIIHNAYWLQDGSNKLLKNSSNTFSFALNLIDSSNGQVVCSYTANSKYIFNHKLIRFM